PAGRLLDGRRGRIGETQIDDLDLVAALLVEADRGAHQRGDAVELLLGARLVDDVALVVLGVAAVDQHGRRHALDAAAFGHLGLGGARDLVVDDLLGLAAVVARAGRIGLRRRAGQLVADADRGLARRARGAFLARLAGAQHAAFGVEAVERLGDAVEVEVGGKLHARPAGADHRGDDRFDLVPQAALER